MGTPFIGEIRMVAFTFAPEGWIECNGQEMPITQNQALYALLGTQFGGDGRTTFAVPDLRGRTPIHPDYDEPQISRQGFFGGYETVKLSLNEVPAHTHAVMASNEPGDSFSAKNKNRVLAVPLEGGLIYGPPMSNPSSFHPDAVEDAVGENLGHNNLQPSIVEKYVIATEGVFPPRQ